MSYTHLTIEERCCIRKYYVEDLSCRKIAELIGRNVSTVSRELSIKHIYVLDFLKCNATYTHAVYKLHSMSDANCKILTAANILLLHLLRAANGHKRTISNPVKKKNTKHLNGGLVFLVRETGL